MLQSKEDQLLNKSIRFINKFNAFGYTMIIYRQIIILATFLHNVIATLI